VSFVSLNIMFFTACKFCNLRASVAVILKKSIRFISSPLPRRAAQVYLSLTFDITGAGGFIARVRVDGWVRAHAIYQKIVS
jgi:hypothetical protein